MTVGRSENDMGNIRKGHDIMRRGYGLFDFLIEGAFAAADYIADEQREKRGQSQRNNVYLGDLSGNRTLDFAEQLRMDMEREKAMREATEQQKRDNYNFSNRNTGMDDLFAGIPNVGAADNGSGGTNNGNGGNNGGSRNGGSHGFWSD